MGSLGREWNLSNRLNFQFLPRKRLPIFPREDFQRKSTRSSFQRKQGDNREMKNCINEEKQENNKIVWFHEISSSYLVRKDYFFVDFPCFSSGDVLSIEESIDNRWNYYSCCSRATWIDEFVFTTTCTCTCPCLSTCICARVYTCACICTFITCLFINYNRLLI